MAPAERISETLPNVTIDTPWVQQLELGPKKNFVYLVGAPGGREAFVVDPAWDVEAIIDAAEAVGRTVVAAFLTHHHDDHVNGVPALLQLRDIPVHVQQAERAFAPQVFAGYASSVRAVDPGSELNVAGVKVRCLHTPGHTPGAQCLQCAGAAFTGDTLFVNACGRCDFPGGSPEQMFDSLHHTLSVLPGDTQLFTGHDYGDVKVSTMERERERNPYFQLEEESAFVKFRMRK